MSDISFDTIPTSIAAGGVYIEQKPESKSTAVKKIPAKNVVIGTYNSGYTPTIGKAQLLTSVADAYTRYGRGSLLARMVEKAWKAAGGTDIYALPVAEASGATAATGSVTVGSAVTKSGTVALYIGGHRVAVAATKGMTTANLADAINTAINADLDLPVSSTVTDAVVTLTAKCKGTAGNMLVQQDLKSTDGKLEPTGGALTLVSLTGGATDPSITDALSGLGDTFYTVISCPWNDATTLESLETYGDSRAAYGVKRPYISAVAYNGTEADYLTAIAATNNKWVSPDFVENGSSPVAEIAASYGARIAYAQDRDPARTAKTLSLPDIVGGTDENLTYEEKNAIVKAGGSYTYRDASGIVHLGDCVTNYKTNDNGVNDSETTFRYVTTITKMQAKIYSLDQMFSSDPFTRAIIISDSQVSNKAYALSPKAVKGFLINLVDQWIAECWSKDRDTIVKGIVCQINSTTPSRMDCYVPDVMSGELAIIGVQYAWSFSSAE